MLQFFISPALQFCASGDRMLVLRTPKAALVHHTTLPHHQSGPGFQSRAPESLVGEEGILLKVGTFHECWGCSHSDCPASFSSSESCPGFMGRTGLSGREKEVGDLLMGETHLKRSAESSFKYCQQ